MLPSAPRGPVACAGCDVTDGASAPWRASAARRSRPSCRGVALLGSSGPLHWRAPRKRSAAASGSGTAGRVRNPAESRRIWANTPPAAPIQRLHPQQGARARSTSAAIAPEPPTDRTDKRWKRSNARIEKREPSTRRTGSGTRQPADDDDPAAVHHEQRRNELQPRARTKNRAAGKLIYSSADGHNHWHLQQIAKLLALERGQDGRSRPAQKVGFCLDDSEGQHRETGIGPSKPAYSDETGRKFCKNGNRRRLKCGRASRPGGATTTAANWPAVGRHLQRRSPANTGSARKSTRHRVRRRKRQENNRRRTRAGDDPRLRRAAVSAVTEDRRGQGAARDRSVDSAERMRAEVGAEDSKIVSGPSHGTLGTR